jgi:hypothetical protein
MQNFLKRADAVLRGDADLPTAAPSWQNLRHLTICIGSFGFFYGAVMGSFGGVSEGRFWQILYSATKVPLLLLTTFCLSLPSFFVLNTLLGVRGDFTAAIRGLLATQAGLTIILAGLAPFTALWYFSSDNYPAAILFNGAIFTVASFSAQMLLRRYYAPLVARDSRHRKLLWAWIILYSFVAIQMAWLLRPFVGDPHADPEFFRHDSWGNAYVVVARLIWSAIRAR